MERDGKGDRQGRWDRLLRLCAQSHQGRELTAGGAPQQQRCTTPRRYAPGWAGQSSPPLGWPLAQERERERAAVLEDEES